MMIHHQYIFEAYSAMMSSLRFDRFMLTLQAHLIHIFHVSELMLALSQQILQLVRHLCRRVPSFLVNNNLCILW